MAGMVLTLLAAVILQQPQPPNIGVIHNHDFKLDGGYYLSLELDAQEPKLEDVGYYGAYCTSACKGGKHATHAECDSTCDKPCTEKHSYTMTTYLTFPKAEKDANYGKFSKAIKDATKRDPSESPTQQLNNSLEVMLERKVMDDAYGEDKSKGNLTLVWEHWAKPCSKVHRIPLAWRTPIKVHWELGQEVSGANGKKEMKEVSKGDFVANLDLPSKEYKDEKPLVECLCAATKDKNEMSAPIDQTAYIYQKGSPPVELCSADVSKYGFTFVCKDMNTGEVTATNYQPMPVDLVVQEGLVLHCLEDSDQDMVVVRGCMLHLPGWIPLCGTAEPATGQIRLHCINMTKHEPNSNLKYVPELPGSETLRRLAVFQSHQMIGGPWDQARTWIWTDHATLDQINKVMMLPLGESSYLRALWQLSTVDPSLDWSSDEMRPCLQPSLIVGAVQKEATEWFVGEMAFVDPGGLANWVDQNGAAFAPLWQNTGNSLAPNHLADICSAMVGSRSPQIRAAGIRFMLQTVPADQRDIVVKNGGLEGLKLALIDTDSAVEAGQLLDVAEEYPSSELALGLRNVSKALPDSVHQRAAALLAKTGG